MHKARLLEPPRTLVTVQVGEASTLASKRDSIGIEGSCEGRRAAGSKIRSTFRYVASGSRRPDPDGNAETVNEGDIVKVLSISLTQGELRKSDRRDTLFIKGIAQLQFRARGGGMKLTGNLHARPPTQAPIAQSRASGLLKSQLRLPQIRPAVQLSGTLRVLDDPLRASHLKQRRKPLDPFVGIRPYTQTQWWGQIQRR